MRIRLKRDLIQYGRVYKTGQKASETVIASQGAVFEGEWRESGPDRRRMVALRDSGDIWLIDGDWELLDDD